MTAFKDLIAKVADGHALSLEEARQAFEVILSGSATPSQLGGFLMALRVRGESIAEVTGAVTTMRSKMLPVKAPVDAIDIVGTGGEAAGQVEAGERLLLADPFRDIEAAAQGVDQLPELAARDGQAHPRCRLGRDRPRVDCERVDDVLDQDFVRGKEPLKRLDGEGTRAGEF